jgi:hypothetical protein
MSDFANAINNDVVTQLKKYVLGQAYQAVDAIQEEITTAVEAALSSDDLYQFKQAMSNVGKNTVQKTGEALYSALEEAQQLSEGQDSSTIDFMMILIEKAKKMFPDINIKVRGFVEDAASSEESFLSQANSKIKDFFDDLSTFIDGSIQL